MKVAILSQGVDTGGQGYRLKEALDRHAEGYTVRALSGVTNYTAFPRAEEWDWRVIERLIGWADVVHTKTTLRPYQLFDKGRNRPVVLHHHGTVFRETPRDLLALADQYGALTVASTADLTLYREDIRWLPSPQDVPDLARQARTAHSASKWLRVLHAPTNRRVKSTGAFLAAMDRLRHVFPRLRVEVIEGKPWREVIAAKAERTDIYFDQLNLGYGQNALECFAMGIPVVAGASPAILARMVELGGPLPFHPATEATLYDDMAQLLESAELRAEVGERGRAYVTAHHDYPVVADRLRELYAEAIERKAGHSPYVHVPVPRGTVQRVGPGQWRRALRDGVWAGIPQPEALRLEAEFALGEPVTTGALVGPAIRKALDG